MMTFFRQEDEEYVLNEMEKNFWNRETFIRCWRTSSFFKNLRNSGIRIKISGPNCIFFYYEECAGSCGRGALDWSKVKNRVFFEYFRNGCMVFHNNRSYFLPGLLKSRTSSQMRRAIDTLSGKACVSTKTDGSAISLALTFENGKCISEASCTNGNCVVDARLRNALDKAFNGVDYCNPSLYSIGENCSCNITMHLELVSNFRLVSLHPEYTVYFNQVTRSIYYNQAKSVLHLAVHTKLNVEEIRQKFEGKGARCPQRFMHTLEIDNMTLNQIEDCVISTCLEDAIQMELKAHEKYTNGTVSEANLRLCFEGFVVNIAGQSMKIKTPIFCLLNKMTFGKEATPEQIIEKLTLIANKIPSFPDELKNLAHKYQSFFDDILVQIKSKRTYSYTKKQELNEIINELNIIQFKSFPETSISIKDDKECIFDENGVLKTMSYFSKKLQGRADEYTEVVWSEHFKQIHNSIKGVSVKMYQQIISIFRELFGGSSNDLLIVLALSKSVLDGSEFKTEKKKWTFQQPSQEYLDTACEQLHNLSKPIIFFDLDGTLLKEDSKIGFIRPFNNKESRLCLEKNQEIIDVLDFAKDTCSICILTGAKLDHEEICEILDHHHIYYDCVIGGEWGVLPEIQKKVVIEMAIQKNMECVALIDDNIRVKDACCDLLPVFQVNTVGNLGKDPRISPTAMFFCALPGFGKSTLREMIMNTMENCSYVNLDEARIAGKAEGNEQENLRVVNNTLRDLLSSLYDDPYLVIVDYMNLNSKDIGRSNCNKFITLLVPRQLCERPKFVQFDEFQNLVREIEKSRENILETLKERIGERDVSKECAESTFHMKHVKKGLLETKFNEWMKTLNSNDFFGSYERVFVVPWDLNQQGVELSVVPIIYEYLEQSKKTQPFTSYIGLELLDEGFKDKHVTIRFAYEHMEALKTLMLLVQQKSIFKVDVTSKNTNGEFEWYDVTIPNELMDMFPNDRRPHITMKAPKGEAVQCGVLPPENTELVNFDLTGRLRVF